MENIIPRKSRPEETDNLEKDKQHTLAWGLRRPLVDSVDRPVASAVAGPATQLCRMFAEPIMIAAESQVSRKGSNCQHYNTFFRFPQQC